jgi:protein SCO1/2
MLACAQPAPHYPLTGRVVEIRGPTEVVVAHDAVPGFMDAMTMPFRLDAPVDGLRPGDRIAAELVTEGGTRLEHVTVTGHEDLEQPPDLAPGQEVPVGAIFPPTDIQLAVGSPVTIGQGQQGRFAVTFFYTRCPIPEYCPLTISRLQALQPELPPGARILAITLDPEFDSRGTLKEFGEAHGAQPGKWDFGKVPEEVLVGLAEKAGLETAGDGKIGIVHDVVLLVLDQDGRLIRRYRDNKWDQAELVRLLTASP